MHDFSFSRLVASLSQTRARRGGGLPPRAAFVTTRLVGMDFEDKGQSATMVFRGSLSSLATKQHGVLPTVRETPLIGGDGGVAGSGCATSPAPKNGEFPSRCLQAASHSPQPPVGSAADLRKARPPSRIICIPHPPRARSWANHAAATVGERHARTLPKATVPPPGHVPCGTPPPGRHDALVSVTCQPSGPLLPFQVPHCTGFQVARRPS